MLLVDAYKRAIGAVAVEGVVKLDNAIGTRSYLPAIRVGPANGQQLAGAISCHGIVHIFHKLVQGVAARRRASHAHSHLFASCQPAKRGGYASLMVHGIRKSYRVARCRLGAVLRNCPARHQERTYCP